MQRVGILNGENLTNDHDISRLVSGTINHGVSTGLKVNNGSVSLGEAIIKVERSGGKSFYITYENTDSIEFDTSGTKKIYIEISQEKIDDGSINSEDGTGIGEIKSGATFPSKNFLKLASINNGVINDEREFISIKNSVIENSGLGDEVTKMGNTFNGAGKLVKLTTSGKLPAVDGSNLTNLNVSSDGVSINKISGEYINKQDAVRLGKTISLYTEDYSNGVSDGYFYGLGYNSANAHYGFNFTVPSGSNILKDFTFHSYKAGNPTDSVVATIYEVSSLTSSGPHIGYIGQSEEVSCLEIPAMTNDAPITVSFPSLPFLDENKIYRILLSRTGAYNSSNFPYVCKGSNNASYVSGKMFGLGFDFNNLEQTPIPWCELNFGYKRIEDENKIYKCQAEESRKERFLGIAKENIPTGTAGEVAVEGVVRGVSGLNEMEEVNVSTSGSLEQNKSRTPYVKVGQMLCDGILKLN